MHKIGIIGDRDSVLGFMALGFAVHEVRGGEEAESKISELVKSGEYGTRGLLNAQWRIRSAG